MESGLVFNIQKYSVHDGPGIRTTGYAALALELAAKEPRPARAPRDFQEALQACWFCHLAVIKSAAKMDHVKTGGRLLNLKFSPGLVSTEEGFDKWAHLVRSYFKLDGHHVQFNVVTAETLRQAQAQPEQHRDLIVRVAGYSDYFCDLSTELQEEILARTEHHEC
jgi:pyruvate-formate lyase